MKNLKDDSSEIYPVWWNPLELVRSLFQKAFCISVKKKKQCDRKSESWKRDLNKISIKLIDNQE